MKIGICIKLHEYSIFKFLKLLSYKFLYGNLRYCRISVFLFLTDKITNFSLVKVFMSHTIERDK